VAEYPIGPDIDLDVEEVYLPDGRRLTEAGAEQLGEEALARHRGRLMSPEDGGERRP
jgi:hypothetical protein